MNHDHNHDQRELDIERFMPQEWSLFTFWKEEEGALWKFEGE